MMPATDVNMMTPANIRYLEDTLTGSGHLRNDQMMKVVSGMWVFKVAMCIVPTSTTTAMSAVCVDVTA